ncbi:MAG: TPM domain-containing protein [Betaproteobacteria bacterium]|nr:TPM domain-containing protein [Betaproteobacteria bacterium]
MRFAARLLLALWLSAAGTLGLAADDLVAVPALKAHVTDLAGLLSGNQATALEARLAQFEKVHGSQIAILLVPTTQPEAIESYAIRVAEAWKIGRTGIEDGILLLVARNDRTLRIEVGRGLEGVLPDAVAKRIITEVIEPRFGEGDFFGGLQDGVMRIEAVLAGEPLPPPQERARGAPSADIWESLVPLAMLFVFVAGGLLRALFGRLLGGAVAGGVAFLGGWLLLGSVSLALLVAVVVFFLTLLGVAGVGGMRGLGGRGGFGGGGGFSGGGGGFGGGGASGRW